MKIKNWLCGILLVLMLVVCVPCASAIEEAPEIEANNAMLISLNTGATIYEKNADERIYPASTTKLMTMAVAIDLIADLQEQIIFDKSASYEDLVVGSSNMGLKDGEEITLEQLMYGIAISSANEGTNALAIHLCGSIAAFVEQMNVRAAELGMNGTHFVNTHGLTDENHYTTARDMAILAKKVFSDSRLLPYLSASSYTLPATNKNAKRTLISTNKLIRLNSGEYYKYCVAGKTGTTTAAGYNLVSSAKYKGMEYICVAMNADYSNPKNPVFEDSTNLYRWAYQNYSVKTLMTPTTSVCEIDVALCAKSDYVMLVPAAAVEGVVADDVITENYIVVREGEDMKAALAAKPDTQFVWIAKTEGLAYAPVKVGDVLGTVTVASVDKQGNVQTEYGTVDLVASSELERSTILYYLHLIRTFFSNTIVRIITIVLILAIIAYIIFMILQNNNRRKRRIARRIRF